MKRLHDSNEEKKKKSKKRKNENEKNEVKRIVFKPRYGVSLTCDICKWKFRGGGYTTKKEADNIEKSLKKMHEKEHTKNLKINPPPKKLSIREAEQQEILKIRRTYHAAEITHNFLEYNTRQTTTSTTYVDVPNTTITNALTSGQDHLVIVTAQFDSSVTNGDVNFRVVRGTTPTAIADSEVIFDPAVDPVGMVQRWPHMWWGIVNPGGSTENLKLQYSCGTATASTAGIDLISIMVVKLTPDKTVNVDYKSDLQTANTSISATTTNPGDASSDTASNNASITLTPSVTGHKWLIGSKARYTGTATTTGAQSRISHSGGSTSNEPTMQKEGEDATNEAVILCGLRVDTLTNVSQTYTEISKGVNTGAGAEGVSSTRTHSGIFMLDLDGFQTAVANQEDTPFEDIGSTTDYGTLVHTQSTTPTTAGDVAILGFVTGDYGGSGNTTNYYKMRMQVDNADPEASTVTTKAYALMQYDSADRLPCLYQTVESLTAASHTVDIDGSVHTAASAGEGTYTRNITIFSMEMAGAALKSVIPENIGITESIIVKKGTALVKIVSESVGITESVIKTLSTGTAIMIPENLQLRLSGGASNTDPTLSLGGAKSTVTSGSSIAPDFDVNDFVDTDFNTDSSGSGPTGIISTILLDNVLQSEAAAGDTEYRCFYIHNTHATLTMQDLKLWISVNTSYTSDEVWIGLGGSAINGTEQTIANENTAPNSPTITFSLAATEGAAISVGNLPAGQHKAIWIKRIVSANSSGQAYFNNIYVLSAKWYSDHS